MAIVTVTAWVEEPDPLVAEIITVEAPTAVGTPEIRPVAVFTDNPAGKPVAAKLVGPLLAVIW